jgi:hypothetical protein
MGPDFYPPGPARDGSASDSEGHRANPDGPSSAGRGYGELTAQVDFAVAVKFAVQSIGPYESGKPGPELQGDLPALRF